jgi:DNA-binding MarR family transcriptional regulator
VAKVSAQDRVLDSTTLTDSGRRVAKQLMKVEGLVLERLFNYLGDLEDCLNLLETNNTSDYHL